LYLRACFIIEINFRVHEGGSNMTETALAPVEPDEEPRSNVIDATPYKLSVEELEMAIRKEVAACEENLTRGLQHALKAGRLLIELKKRKEVKHGEFLPAVTRCGLKPRAAQDYMRIARHWPELEKYADVAHLTLRDAITRLTWIGANAALDDFPEEDFRAFPEPPPTLAVPAAWRERRLALSMTGKKPRQETDDQFTDKAMNAQLVKIKNALERALGEYETFAGRLLTIEKRDLRTVKINPVFYDRVEGAFARVVVIHGQFAQAVIVNDMRQRSEAAERQAEASERREADDEWGREAGDQLVEEAPAPPTSERKPVAKAAKRKAKKSKAKKQKQKRGAA
jgi:hypothetical protein